MFVPHTIYDRVLDQLSGECVWGTNQVLVMRLQGNTTR